MKAAWTSKMYTALCHNPEDLNLNPKKSKFDREVLFQMQPYQFIFTSCT